MKLQLDKQPSINRVGAFVGNTVVIGEVGYVSSLIVTPETIIPSWPPKHVDELTINDFEMLLECQPELILVGTGKSIQFPDPEILQGIFVARIGVDFMDSRAVCRTYNILAAEGRNVAAGIIINH